MEKVAAGYAKLSPQFATTYNTQIADVLRELGDYKRAEALLLQHLKTVEKQWGKKHPALVPTQLGIARALVTADAALRGHGRRLCPGRPVLRA